MKKLAFILLSTISLVSIFGCNNSEFRYGYQGDYLNDPQLRQDADRDHYDPRDQSR